jgi:magnesium transporter
MHAYLFDGSDVRELDSLDQLGDATEGLPFWWLDIEAPPAEPQALLPAGGDLTTAAWLVRFGHVPRYHWEAGRLRVVAPAYGDGAVREVHVLAMDTRLVSTHQDGCTQLFHDIRTRTSANKQPPTGVTSAIILLEDLLDTFRPVLADLRTEMYRLSESILVSPAREQMSALVSIRHRFNQIWSALVTYADAAEDFSDRLSLLPDALDADREIVQGHAAHAGSMARQVEALQEAASHAMEVYVSMVTTRQGQVINWLTFVSIVFLPLTFITGFFGMNFDWMVNNISSPAHFWILGIGLQVVTVALVFITGRRLFPVLRGDVRGNPANGLDPSTATPTAPDPAPIGRPDAS